MNYSELLSNVRNYTEVGSEVLSDAVLNVFIENVENKIQKQPNPTTTKNGGAFSGKQNKSPGCLFTPFNSNAGSNVSLYGV